MARYEHTFCRILLKDTMEEVKKRYTTVQIKSAWLWKAGRGHFVFHFGDHCDHFSAGCAYEARSKGWERLMQKEGEHDKESSNRKGPNESGAGR